MRITFTVRYVNIYGDDYEDTVQGDFDIDLVFAYIRPMLREEDMNRLEAVTYNGGTVHPETTLADLGMVDGGSYHLDVYFPVADEDSDDYSDRVLPSPDTDASVSDWEGWEPWETHPTAAAQAPVGGQHPVEEHYTVGEYEYDDLGLDPNEVY